MRKKMIQMVFSCVVIIGLVQLTASSIRAQSEAETLFKAKCAPCHGADGKAETTMGKTLKIPAFGSPAAQGQSEAQLTEIVTKGKNKMPAYDGKLSKEQIAGLVAYVRELGKKH